MGNGYKEAPLLNPQPPSPWKLKSLPKFNDVSGRNFFNNVTNLEINDGDPRTPPLSSSGTFKYPALLRGNSNVRPRTISVKAIVTELYKNRKSHTTQNPGDEEELEKIHEKTAQQDFTMKIKPARSGTEPNCSKFDKNLLKETGSKNSAGSLQTSTSAVEGDAKIAEISEQKKWRNNSEAEDDRNEMTLEASENCFSTMSTRDFNVIFKHALSHDPIIQKHKDSDSWTKKSMTFA